MKILIFIPAIILFTACNQQNHQLQEMQIKMDSLEKQLANTYKPGFGEFMSGIQVHHAKLWFAGQKENWKLADFEIHEIQETLEDIQKFNTERPEMKAMGMIYPALDSVSHAIQQKNQQLFKNSFISLTQTCNNCHKATKHEFNVVIIPTNLPVVNQDFKPVH